MKWGRGDEADRSRGGREHESFCTEKLCFLFHGCKCVFQAAVENEARVLLPPKGTFSLSTTSPNVEEILSPWTGGHGSET